MDVIEYFTFVTLVVTLAILYYTWIFGYWRRKNVQTLTPNFIFGNIGDVLLGKVGFADTLARTYKKFRSKGERYAGYYCIGKPIFVVLDPKLIETVCAKDFAHFTDRPSFADKEKDALSVNLFTMKLSEWKKMRNILSPAFTTNKLKMMLEYFLVIGTNLKTAMDEAYTNAKMVELKDISSKYIVDIIATTFIGIDCNSLLNQDNDFSNFLRVSFNRKSFQNIRIFFAIFFPSIFHYIGGRINEQKTIDFYISLTKQIVEYRESNNVRKKDFMQLMIDIRNHIDIEKSTNADLSLIKIDERKKLLSIEDIASEIFVFFAAGSESSSSAITFCLFELEQNPETKEKLLQEIDNVLEKHNGEITYEALSEMSYMEMCIKEINRMYPALPFLSRVCTKDWQVPGSDLVITKGTDVYLPTKQVQLDPEYFPNPNQFDPERFSFENRNKILPGAYIPFGEGPHMCIGMRIAILSIKVALTTLLKNYRFSLNPRTKVPLEKNKTDIFFGVKNGIWMNVEKINN